SGNMSRRSGGGISNAYAGTVTLTNATVSGNSASYGGGIYNDSYYDEDTGVYYAGTVTLINSTVSGNSGGGIYNYYGTLHARNTLLASNTATIAPDLWGSLGSLGHNLISNTSGGSDFAPTDLLDVDPLLGPLQDNGGPTKT